MHTHLPITINDLKTLKSQLCCDSSISPLEKRLLWAAFTFAFFGFLRTSEFATAALIWQHIHLSNWYICLLCQSSQTLCRSKHTISSQFISIQGQQIFPSGQAAPNNSCLPLIAEYSLQASTLRQPQLQKWCWNYCCCCYKDAWVAHKVSKKIEKQCLPRIHIFFPSDATISTSTFSSCQHPRHRHFNCLLITATASMVCLVAHFCLICSVFCVLLCVLLDMLNILCVALCAHCCIFCLICQYLCVALFLQCAAPLANAPTIYVALKLREIGCSDAAWPGKQTIKLLYTSRSVLRTKNTMLWAECLCSSFGQALHLIYPHPGLHNLPKLGKLCMHPWVGVRSD